MTREHFCASSCSGHFKFNVDWPNIHKKVHIMDMLRTCFDKACNASHHIHVRNTQIFVIKCFLCTVHSEQTLNRAASQGQIRGGAQRAGFHTPTYYRNKNSCLNNNKGKINTLKMVPV